MDGNVSTQAAIVVTAVAKKVAFTSPLLLSNMVIFNDISYVIIMALGSFVSFTSTWFDIKEKQRQGYKAGDIYDKHIGRELIKALALGGIVTLLCFLIFSQIGVHLIGMMFGIGGIHEMLPSFWFVLSLAFGSESVRIWYGGRLWISKRLA